MEYEEEEIIVYTDFQQSILSVEELDDPNVNIKIIGIDKEHPLIIINSKIFKGTFEYSSGTHVFFCDDAEYSERRAQDAIFDKQIFPYYKFADKTNKVLKMKRIFVSPVNPTNEKGEEISEEKEKDNSRFEVSKTYDEALNQFLKPGEERPRELAESSTKSDELKTTKGSSDEDDKDDTKKDTDYIPYDLDVG